MNTTLPIGTEILTYEETMKRFGECCRELGSPARSSHPRTLAERIHAAQEKDWSIH